MSETSLPAVPPPARSWADLSAYALTYLVSPLSLPVLVAVAAVRALGGSWREAEAAALVAFVGNGLVPLAVLLVLFGSGRVASLEVREQRRRTLPYLAGALGTLISAAGLWRWLPPDYHVLVVATLWQAFNTLVLLAVNRRTKVSVHLYALASGTALLVLLHLQGASAPIALLAGLVLALPVLAWARVRLKAHTLRQVVLGALLGVLLLPLELWVTAHLTG